MFRFSSANCHGTPCKRPQDRSPHSRRKCGILLKAEHLSLHIYGHVNDFPEHQELHLWNLDENLLHNMHVHHSEDELNLGRHRHERETAGTHAAWSQGRHPTVPRPPVSKRRPYPLHHREAFAENTADAAVATGSTPSRTQSMPDTRNTPSRTRSRLHHDAQPQRSRPSNRARQCARYLYPAPGRRCTHHKLAASSSPHCSRFVTRSRHSLRCSDNLSLHCSRFVTRSDCS